MDLSLDQAAALLGRSVRQVRYMVEKGRLPAKKDGARWTIRREDLPLSDAQLHQRARQIDRLQDRVEDALHVQAAPPRFSTGDLKAFQVGRPLYLAVSQQLGADHPAALALRRCLLALGLGCHRFHAAEKGQAYREARDAAATAAVELLLFDPASAAARAVEQELLAAIAGLLRRSDRPERTRASHYPFSDFPP